MLFRSGDPEAQYWLADRYYLGSGVRRDEKLAAKWFLKAADQNDLGAQVHLAYAYSFGDGVPKNIPAFLLWKGLIALRDDSSSELLDKAKSEVVSSEVGVAVREWVLKHAYLNTPEIKFQTAQLLQIGRAHV